ncbi:MAG: 50S ribosomal protein L30 [Candidatus Glassbacteria bacterium RBG_16_58_8]|uniref:50S ribosomal protein L30 n=1 Tax=Candidatus Glassbacteria bacterium RBG_16_58_8 TaxID=1817866 RepID=A0A1F5Y9Y3_9BACT|nr:MAG: 50S ribosomal protein L30 [Candidatus Glassbacteria bacterium RBG_16_58_8]
MPGKLQIKQVRSRIKRPESQRRTLIALGLTHHQKVVIQPDNPQIRGMIRKVSHLVEVKEIEG